MMALERDRSEGRMDESYGGRVGGASVREAQRTLTRLGGTAPPAGDALLETRSQPAMPPHLERAELIEGTRLEARDVAGAPVPGCSAFLDGIQRSVIASYVGTVVPVVHGTVAAAIRRRTDRALGTWGGGPLVQRSLHLPVALAGRALIDALEAAGISVVDTLVSDATADAPAARHPQELLALARQSVQHHREQLEERLAGAWCAGERSVLYVDGGLSGFTDASRSPHVIGVVKSHRTLYVAADSVTTLASLRAGQRSSAFLVATRRRARVASWYLRLRANGDPLAGLVRVEVAEAGFDSARADLVSRWVLAEREPVSLPDARWQVMAYGIRDCEEYLRAVAG